MISRRNLIVGTAAAGLFGGVAEASKLLVPASKKAKKAPAAVNPMQEGAEPEAAAPAAPVAEAASSSGDNFQIDMDEWKKLEYKFQRRDVEYKSDLAPGTIFVDASLGFLYLITGPGTARRWGVSVGKSSKAWSGEVTVAKMTKWPIWTPTPYHLSVQPSLAKWLPGGMPGGPDNPLGARAMYLYKGNVDTVNRIHGGMKLAQIGERKTAGCIGMLNCDVIDLYSRIQVGTLVVLKRGFSLFG